VDGSETLEVNPMMETRPTDQGGIRVDEINK
jgi:hypothetical protein